MRLRQTEGSMAEVTLANKGSWRAFNRQIVRASLTFSFRNTYSAYLAAIKNLKINSIWSIWIDGKVYAETPKLG